MTKKIIIFLICLISISLVMAATAPEFNIELLDGKIVKSTDILAKGPIFLDFWSTSCQPCIRSMPIYSEFAKKYPEVNFYAISTDSPRNKNKVIQQVRTQKYNFTTGFDSSGDLARLFNVTELPRLFIIDQNGEIVFEKRGFTPGDEVGVEAKIIELLKAGRNESE